MSEPSSHPELPRRIAVRLADLPRRYLVLKQALEDFGDAGAFVEAAGSSDPRELARAYVLERAFEVVENSLTELARHGLIHAGLRDAGAGGSARADFRTLHEAGVISDAQRRLLVAVQQRRTQLGHDYVDAQARSTWEAAQELREKLPDLIRAYRDWLARVVLEDAR